MSVQKGLTSPKRFKPSYLYSVISITLVLFLVGILSVLIIQAQRLSKYFKENIEVAIILKDNVNKTEAFQFQKMLEGEPYINRTEFVSMEEAAKKLQEELGQDFIDLLGYNPLFNSVNIYLKAAWANPDSLDKIKREILSYKQVSDVLYQENLVDVINKNVRTATIAIAIISFLFLFVAITLIDNTLRLSMYSNRFLIRSMQLVGATRWFIIKPFLIKSLVNGFISALVALTGLMGIVYYANLHLNTLIVMDDLLTFTAIGVGIILLGLVISGISTYLSVRKYLRMKLDELY